MRKSKYIKKIYNISDKEIVKNLKIKKRILNKKQQNYDQNKSILSKILGKKINLNFRGLSIDSRLVKKIIYFWQLRVKNKDGNKFIKDALKKGACCVASSLATSKDRKK